MLLTILTQMSNDEQRVRLLHTLKNRLMNYHLDWKDIRKIVGLFSARDQIRLEILQFLLFYLKHFHEKLDIDDYIELSNQCTNNNEQLRIRLFEQIYEKLNIRDGNDFQRISDLFQTSSIKQKIEAINRDLHADQPQSDYAIEETVDQHSFSPQLTSNQMIAPGTSSCIEQISVAPLKRKCSFDHESCHRILTPSLIEQHDECIVQRDILSSMTTSSSSDSSLSSASDEIIPIRTRSFMIAIKKTFERLKETSSLFEQVATRPDDDDDDQKTNARSTQALID